MALKSVIDIDLDDSKFARFKELFDRYHETLAKTPAIWKSVNKEQQNIATAFERHTAAMLAQIQLGHETEEEDKNRFTRLSNSERLWVSISKSSATIAKNVLDIGAGVLKWGAIIGGGLLGGSLFGLNRLGGAVGEERRSSMGLGLSIGEQQAFKVNFGRMVNSDSFLSGINSAVSDLSKQGPLYAIGVNPNQSTEEVALQTLKVLRQKALATPVNQLGILESAYGLQDLGVSLEDLRRLRATPEAEFQGQMRHFGQDVTSFGLPPDVALKWQDFSTQMSRAGETIFKTFVLGLGPLAAPLEHLSAAFVKFLGTAMAPGGLMDKAINNVAKWLDSFAGTLETPAFLESVRNFVSDVGVMAHAIREAIDWIKGVPAVKDQPGAALLGGVQGAVNANWRDQFKKDPSTQKYLGLLAEADKNFSLPAGTLERQWMAESGGSLNPANSKKGAMGPFQFMPDTASELGIHPHDPLQAAWGAGVMDSRLLNKYHGDMQKALAAYDFGEGNLDKVIHAHPTDWLLYTPTETQGYVKKQMTGQAPGVVININNNTGGSAIVSASQLGPP